MLEVKILYDNDVIVLYTV